MIERYDVKVRSPIPQILEVLPPDAEPLGVQDYLNYSNIKLQIQKDVFAQKLISARQSIEDWTGRALVTRTVDQIVDYDPKNNPTGIPLYMTGALGEIDLRLPPVRKINQVIVYDPFRNPTLVDPAVYQTLFIRDPGTKLIVTLGHVWPGILSDIEAIRITCVSGYTTFITLVTPGTNSPLTSGTITAPGHPYINGDVFRLTMFYGSNAATPSAPGGIIPRKNYYIANVNGDTFQIASDAAGLSLVNITSPGSGALYAGEVPMKLIRAVMITASADLFQDEYDETGKEPVSIPKAARDLCARYKRRYI